MVLTLRPWKDKRGTIAAISIVYKCENFLFLLYSRRNQSCVSKASNQMCRIDLLSQGTVATRKFAINLSFSRAVVRRAVWFKSHKIKQKSKKRCIDRFENEM